MRAQDFFAFTALIALIPSTPAAAQDAVAPAVQVAQATQAAPARALGQRIGVAGAVRGEVRIAAHDVATGAVGKVAQSGDPIRLGDLARQQRVRPPVLPLGRQGPRRRTSRCV